MKVEIITCSDGSHTLFVPELNEHYHSVHGALQESLHVFIQSGLKFCDRKNLSILEVGLGTGLNALLTFAERNKTGLITTYTACEPFPVSRDVWQLLNYPSHLHDQNLQKTFREIHNSPWNVENYLSERFRLIKIPEKIETANLPDNTYDLVYFDAFSSKAQPELWTEAIFCKLFEKMVPGGILVTYSASGQVRRNLKEAGFDVERLPGPPGKREMLRALKLINEPG